jgi:hypothetical protein
VGAGQCCSTVEEFKGGEQMVLQCRADGEGGECCGASKWSASNCCGD